MKLALSLLINGLICLGAALLFKVEFHEAVAFYAFFGAIVNHMNNVDLHNTLKAMLGKPE